MVKGAVYVLPNRAECVESFQWVARELAELGGQASLCEGQFFDAATHEEIEQLFNGARDADYAELAERARALAKELKPRRIDEARLTNLDAQITKLRARLAEIVGIDFCHASGRETTEGLVVDLANRLVALRSPGTKPEVSRDPLQRPVGALWITRVGVHVDRIASAWLIRRFIDLDARFKFVRAQGYVPKRGDLRFDMYEAEFTHEGDTCTFEVLLSRFGLSDKALQSIGQIVHDIDLKDNKYEREETAGFQHILNGLCAIHRDDNERIARGGTLLDGLYAHFQAPGRKE
jgi:hypothetical protein